MKRVNSISEISANHLSMTLNSVIADGGGGKPTPAAVEGLESHSARFFHIMFFVLEKRWPKNVQGDSPASASTGRF